MSRRWIVVDTRVWEVDADDAAEACAAVDDAPDLQPICRTTNAEPAVAPPRPPWPALRVL